MQAAIIDVRSKSCLGIFSLGVVAPQHFALSLIFSSNRTLESLCIGPTLLPTSLRSELRIRPTFALSLRVVSPQHRVRRPSPVAPRSLIFDAVTQR